MPEVVLIANGVLVVERTQVQPTLGLGDNNNINNSQLSPPITSQKSVFVLLLSFNQSCFVTSCFYVMLQPSYMSPPDVNNYNGASYSTTHRSIQYQVGISKARYLVSGLAITSVFVVKPAQGCLNMFKRV